MTAVMRVDAAQPKRQWLGPTAESRGSPSEQPGHGLELTTPDGEVS